ncbi:hypothetical protein [Stenotrophomonas bentonitica]|uniref:hypothetical protein n=1 Tax=Stenotrophomonas bentonitica TaxID=1450134 RepID=UPI0031BBBEE0
MPIPLPKSVRAKLENSIAECLRESRIMSGAIFSLSTNAWQLHRIVPKGSQTDTALEQWLGDRHVSDFVQSETPGRAVGKWDPERGVDSFTDIFGEKAPREWAAELVVKLETLPWQYVAYAPLPGKISPKLLNHSNVSLTPTLEVVTGSSIADDSTIGKNWSGRSGHALNGFSWRPDILYTKLEFDGYVAKNGNSDSAHQAMHRMLSLYGMALAIRLLSYHSWSPPTDPPIFYALGIFHSDAESERHVTNVAFDHAHTTQFENLFHRSPNSNGAPTEFEGKLRELGRALSRADARLINASRWYFDSHCGASDQVRFVQVCTALEVLLGDEGQGKETGLSTLMANRCAYLLGNSEVARRNIISAFKKGYQIRSKIVHTGKNKLSSEESDMLHYMQQLCASIIKKECDELISLSN